MLYDVIWCKKNLCVCLPKENVRKHELFDSNKQDQLAYIPQASISMEGGSALPRILKGLRPQATALYGSYI